MGGTEVKKILTTLAELLATLSSGLFAGASVYINLVEHPARMEAGINLALTEFAPSYHRATVTQVSLASLGFLERTRSLEIEARFKVVDRRRVAGVSHTLHGCGYTADEQAIARPGNRERPGIGGEVVDPVGKAACGKECSKPGFLANVLVPARQAPGLARY
jgi:hypothetical protein